MRVARQTGYDRLVRRCLRRWIPADHAPWRRVSAWSNVSRQCWYDWRWQWRHLIRTTVDLEQLGRLRPDVAESLRSVAVVYPVVVSPYYASLMDPDDPADPIRRQAVPDLEEVAGLTDLSPDPLGERRLEVVPGLIHRYTDRVLLIVSNMCSTFCRHCFRKRILGRPGVATAVRHLETAVDYIRRHPEVRDVILSGGDPLVLPTSVLARLLRALRSIPHVEIIRLGTRVPVTLPMRVWDPSLLAVLDRYGPIWCLTQFNHPREVTPETHATVQMLLRVGVPVLNQAVLLRGINDDVETQRALHRALVRACVKPYYLHHTDPVRGTHHFRVSLGRGLEIMEGLRGHISGLAIPTYVVDLPDGGGKVPLLPDYRVAVRPDVWVFRNHRGELFAYGVQPTSNETRRLDASDDA
ncbi:MAG: KamA family radical SAM protein [Acidobacteria bacterium]|nr:KamA family radical SAM protein [Acidobacteriota bacterium]MDW7984652.1 KamA family radical SAM protein [Acidobacteriota bacterium]